MQLATWNVNSLNVRLPQVLDWLTAHPVDVLALQELKLSDDKFPLQAFTDIGYQAQWFGQKTYNGVALLSKSPAEDVVRNIPGFADEQSRVLCGTFDGVRVICAYFPNGQEPGSDKFAYKMRWLDALREWLRAELVAHPQLVLMGDYNITFDDADVWDVLTHRFETCLIQTALANTRGRRIEAAQKLGIGRNTITRKIQELNLE